jgi:threonine dehydratase
MTATELLGEIRQARDRINDSIHVTPCAPSLALSRMLECRLSLKLENLQITGSFKPRGASNKLLQMPATQHRHGVIAASAGNHAQGVAYVAQRLGIPALIVMPETTPLSKVQGTRELGARIELHGSNYDEAFAEACRLREQHGYILVHAFDDLQVIAGQGTIGLELLEQVPDMEVLVVPVGGGGLIAGIASCVSQLKPGVRIIGVEAARVPAMQHSLTKGHVVSEHFANTIADGIAVAGIGKHTLPLVRDYVDEIITVEEEEIAYAIMTLLEKEKTLAEGAGAVGIAALLYQHVEDVRDRSVVAVISGGNIDMTMLARILERGQEHDGRLARLKVVVKDKPGNMAELATIIAEQQANILNIAQNRYVGEVELEETEVELLLETRGWSHVEQIIEAIRAQGLQVK